MHITIKSIISSNENNAALGLVIGWLMVNRRHDTQCTLTLEACPSQPFNMFPCPAAEAVGAAAAAAAVTASLPSPSPRLGHYNYNGGAHPGKTVEVYHLHCHFNEEEGSEEAARALLSSTTQAVKDAGGTPLHDFICAAATVTVSNPEGTDGVPPSPSALRSDGRSVHPTSVVLSR